MNKNRYLLPGDLVSFEGQNYKIDQLDITGIDAPYFRFENHEGSRLGNWYSHKLVGDPLPPVPLVGGGATIVMYSDRHAATVVKVTKTQIHVRQDKATRTDDRGMSDWQEYTYTPDPDAPIVVFRKTKRGYRSANGNHLWIGVRDEHYDHSF